MMSVSELETRSSVRLARLLHAGAASPFAGLMTGLHGAVYRATHGRLGGRWFGNPVLVIETTGRRSGRRRRTPITYVPHDERWVVMPINAGSPRTPAWWLNLRAAGIASVLVRGRRVTVRPRVVQGEERERLWRAYVRQAPAMAEYERMAARDVPVVVLDPR